MKTNIIDAGRIEAMVAQLKEAAGRAKAPGAAAGVGGIAPPGLAGPAATRTGFADALKLSLDNVNAAQGKAEALGKRFAMGDSSVNLSDVMINMQKASIGFQATVQVRNKLVSAYQEMMNMQV